MDIRFCIYLGRSCLCFFIRYSIPYPLPPTTHPPSPLMRRMAYIYIWPTDTADCDTADCGLRTAAGSPQPTEVWILNTVVATNQSFHRFPVWRSPIWYRRHKFIFICSPCMMQILYADANATPDRTINPEPKTQNCVWALS